METFLHTLATYDADPFTQVMSAFPLDAIFGLARISRIARELVNRYIKIGWQIDDFLSPWFFENPDFRLVMPKFGSVREPTPLR